MRLLVIDDSNNVLKTAKIILGKKHDVLCAKGCFEASEILAREKIDLVLLDVEMPRMGGLEYCMLLKASPVIGDLPVIMLSGNNSAFDQAAGEAVGAKGYITKPFSPAHLNKQIEAILNG